MIRESIPAIPVLNPNLGTICIIKLELMTIESIASPI